MASGAVKVEIGQTFPLAEARRAHEALEIQGDDRLDRPAAGLGRYFAAAAWKAGRDVTRAK